MSVVESTTSAVAPAGSWSADRVHSHVSFEVRYAGVNTFRGRFTDFSATLAESVEPTLSGSARVASVDVEDAQLNAHLQTPDFFDAERHPEISFRATELHRVDAEHVEGAGELTIKGVTRPIELVGTVTPTPTVDPFGRERLGLRLEATIDRTDYGVSWNAPNENGGDYLGNSVRLIAELALVRQEG